MTDLRTVLPPPGRTNTTTLFDNHPGDHNQIVDSLNLVAGRVDALENAAYMRVYSNIAARNADTSAHIEGMLSWAAGDQTLAVWHGAWWILEEPFHAFTPRLWIGTVEFALGATPVTGYRHSYGSCQFYISANWGVLGPGVTTGDISMLPPITPDPAANGGFGSMYVSPMAATAPVVGLGLFNGTTTLSGAPHAGQLAIGSPLDGRLLNRNDLPPNGNFNCYASGFYPITEMAV
jgi:hypothetical protein